VIDDGCDRSQHDDAAQCDAKGPRHGCRQQQRHQQLKAARDEMKPVRVAPAFIFGADLLHREGVDDEAEREESGKAPTPVLEARISCSFRYLMISDEAGGLFDRFHALVQHRREQLHAVAHAIEDGEFGADAGRLQTRGKHRRVVMQPLPASDMHERRWQAAEVGIKRRHVRRYMVAVLEIGLLEQVEHGTQHNRIVGDAAIAFAFLGKVEPGREHRERAGQGQLGIARGAYWIVHIRIFLKWHEYRFKPMRCRGLLPLVP